MPYKKKKKPAAKPASSGNSKPLILFALFILVLVLATVLWHQRASLIRMAGRTKIYHRISGLRRTGIPQGDYVHGFDLSRHNGKPDWDKMFAIDYRGDTVKFDFVFIKASEGVLLKDQRFMHNWSEAQRVGLIRGAYHYFHPGRSVERQAHNFISRVELQAGDLPPVIDIEETNGLGRKEIVRSVKEFSDLLQSHYGVKPIIYSGRNFIQQILQQEFSDHHFWIAHYHNGHSLQKIPGIRNSFWQYTESGELYGVGGKVDLNVFHGDIEQLGALCIPKKQKLSRRSV